MEKVENTYSFKGKTNLTPTELMFWVFVDETIDHFGGDDVVAAVMILSGLNVLPTRQKPKGAIKGTSVASVASRRYLNVKLPNGVRLPSFVGSPISFKIRMVNNLGKFVGRAVPVIGWFILAADVVQISYKAINRYNQIAVGDDKVWN
ncbi:hypothetical protein MSP8887_01414 [Marinomonas spartinae]|uniref:STM2901 family protein n=1 Tax=Marinomonas spartinae TaxID=1792290 RepID=UPI000808EE94|nr:hypothetical protein [Marinomonas spartinae]SBS31029.1 hypothetical protein MSP8887_01414 [Marinomonas spartinae]